MRIAVVHNLDFEGDERGVPSYEADAEIKEIADRVCSIVQARGHEAWILAVSDRLDGLAHALEERRPDLVFNLVESLSGDAAREPEVPELLESLSLPYTGNRPAALRLAHAKDETRRVLLSAEVPVPRGIALEGALPGEALSLRMAETALAFPLFVKPARTDASIGIEQSSLVRTIADLERRLRTLEPKIPGPYVVEEYLPGKEINVAIFPEPIDGAYVCTEIDFSGFGPDQAPIVTYDCKWRPGTPDYNARSVPCVGRAPPAEIAEAQRIAKRAFTAIGGTSYGRVDLRVGADGHLRVIDVNPNPDIHWEAGLSIAARSIGIEHDALVMSLVECSKGTHGDPRNQAG